MQVTGNLSPSKAQNDLCLRTNVRLRQRCPKRTSNSPSQGRSAKDSIEFAGRFDLKMLV
jgi:hypothetical protein